MSGYISLSSDIGWQATSGVFRFVANFIAERAGSESLRTQIHDMIEVNLPHQISLEELPPEDRNKVLQILRNDIVGHAQANLAGFPEARGKPLDHVRKLAELAGEIPEGHS
jgi:hypothetical protein